MAKFLGVGLVFVSAMCISWSAVAQAQTEDDGDRGIGGYYEPRGPVRVVVERDPNAEAALSENYVPILVRLTDIESNEPVGLDYVALAGLADSAGRRSTEVFSLNYTYLSNPESAEVGVYKGIIIFPSSGRWTVFVNVFDPLDEATNSIPTALGRGQLDLEVVGATTLISAAEFGEVTELPSSNAGEVVLLAFHSAFGLAWFVVAGALVCIGVPQRRRWFSDRANDLLDRNVNRLIRLLLAVTLIIWATGILNLNVLVAYPPPLSPDQARALFYLPYAQPYTIALYLKIAAYSALTLLLIPLVRSARRAAVGLGTNRWAAAQETESTGRAVPRQPGRGDRLHPIVIVNLGTIAIGGLIILVCVTILKYTHILSESIRSVTP